MQNRRVPFFLGKSKTRALEGESDGLMKPCSSMLSICFLPSSSSRGCILYNGRWTGGTSSSRSVLNSCPSHTGGSPSGRSWGNTSSNSSRTAGIDDGSARSQFGFYVVVNSSGASISSDSYLTNWIIPKKARSTSFLLSIWSIWFTLISSAKWTRFCCRGLTSGNEIHWWSLFTTTIAWVQLMWGFLLRATGFPKSLICSY